MFNEILRDPKGYTWFKTDERMVKITDAEDFRIRKRWFSKSFVLEAKFKNSYGSFFEYRWDPLGFYGTRTEGSLDLDKILKLKGWKALSKGMYDN